VAHVRQYTPEYREHLWNLGKNCLYTYNHLILGMPDLSQERDLSLNLHWDICQFLQGRPPYEPWTRGLLCAFRGSLKSSLATLGWVSHLSIYVPNHATKLVEQKSDNAFRNHFYPLYHLFAESSRADFLYWLYGSWGKKEFHRIPEGFKGWNSNQLVFTRTDPFALPSITYGGIDSMYEGWHGNLVLTDDPEGADADKSDAPNVDSERFIFRRAVPLLRDPSTDKILCVATPHGDSPVVWKVREREEDYRKKNPGKKVWQICWKEVVDAEGNSRWPERFTPELIAGLRMDPDLYDTQYLLLKRRRGLAIFDMQRVHEAFYRWEVPSELLSYQEKIWDWDNLDEAGYPKFESKLRTISPAAMRIFMHCDPKHKEKTDPRRQKPAEAAIVVSGVSPNGHVFVLETWSGNVGLEEYAEKVYWFYRKWKPMKVTFESVGAQWWFWDYAKLLEKGKYRKVISLPKNGVTAELPPLTWKLVETEKKNTQKADWIISQLESWFNYGLLHANKSQDHLLAQIEAFPDPTGLVDILDALAHGPQIWPKSFPSVKQKAEMLRQEHLLLLSNPPDEMTGYATPWTNDRAN
jgi:hypothetical protein